MHVGLFQNPCLRKEDNSLKSKLIWRIRSLTSLMVLHHLPFVFLVVVFPFVGHRWQRYTFLLCLAIGLANLALSRCFDLA